MRTQSICVALAIGLICSFASAQWVQTNGPYGGHMTAFAATGGNLFAGTWGGGVFLTTDNGTSWTAVKDGLTNSYVLALAVIDTTLVIGTERGIFLASNNGTSWTAAGSGLSDYRIQALAVSRANLFAGTPDGVFRSTNKGISWSPTAPTGYVEALAVLDTVLFAGTYFFGGAFRSTDNGSSWSRVNNGLSADEIHVLAVSGANILAGTNRGLFLSSNNGTGWIAANTGPEHQYITALAVDGANIYAGTGGVLRSTDNGTSWKEVNNGLTCKAVRVLGVDGTYLYAGTDEGVFLSTNHGLGWSASNNGITGFVVNALALSGKRLFAGTYFGGVFVSTDNGTNWTAVNSGLDIPWVKCLAVNGTDLFAGADLGGVYRSTNGGLSWIYNGMGNYFIYSLAVSGGNLFCGTYADGLYRLTNGWTNVFWNSEERCIFALATNGNTIFAGGERGVYRSTNNGDSWTLANSGIMGGYVYALAFSGSSLFAGTWGGVFRSTDNGDSWSATNSGMKYNMGQPTVFSFAVSDTNIFAGASLDFGVYLSTNNGTSWTPISWKLANDYVHSLVVSRRYLFAGGGGGGVWRYPLPGADTTADPPDTELPSTFSLAQNYPNPFNPRTTIEYELPAQIHANLKVFNMLGQEVAALVDEVQTAGYKSVEFSASSLPSGVYLYRLTAGSYVQVKKMTILK